MSEFTIEGIPQGKGRPRFGNGRVYTPQATIDYEEKIKLSYLRDGGVNYRDAPIFMQIFIYMPIPKSANKKTRDAMINKDVYPTKKPDFDNIAKVVCDSLNGIAYDDDCQIVDFVCYKIYGENPRIRVMILPLT